MSKLLSMIIVMTVVRYMALNTSAITVQDAMSGDVLLHDDFETASVVDHQDYTSSPVDANPDNAEIGTWVINENLTGKFQVTDYNSPGAYEGSNYLRGRRVSDHYSEIYFNATVHTNPGHHIHFETMLYVSTTNTPLTLFFYGNDNSGTKQTIIIIQFKADGEIHSYDDGSSGLSIVANTWKKFEVDWFLGEGTFTMTYNGEISNAMDLHTYGINNFSSFLAVGVPDAGNFYFDAVPQLEVPEGDYMIKNLTTDMVLAYDNFETADIVDPNDYSASPAKDADPDGSTYPSIWNTIEYQNGEFQVTDYSSPGAYEGNNYLRCHRDGSNGPYLNLHFTEQTNANDAIHFQIMLNVNTTNAPLVMYFYGNDNNGTEQNIIIIQFKADGEIHSYNKGSSGLSYVANAWKKFEVNWNLGASTFTMTYDGQVSSAIGLQTSGINKLSKFVIYPLNTGNSYFDAVVQPDRGTLIVIE